MKTMTTKRTTMKMVTRDAFRYIQLAINVPTVSTLLYIWFQSFFSANILFSTLWEGLFSEFLSFRIIPESLRWLLSKGKVIHGSPTILANPSKVEILQGELDLLKKGSKNWRKTWKKGTKSWRWRRARRWDARKPWSPPTFATTPLNWTLQASGVVWALEAQKPGQQGSNAIATQKVFCVSGELLHV